jgi:hypothetical protein
MMGLTQNIKSMASAAARLFVSPVFWQRDIKTEQGIAISIQARESNVIGIRTVVPGMETNYTVLLTVDEAQKISNYLADAITQSEPPTTQQRAQQ